MTFKRLTTPGYGCLIMSESEQSTMNWKRWIKIFLLKRLRVSWSAGGPPGTFSRAKRSFKFISRCSSYLVRLSMNGKSYTLAFLKRICIAQSTILLICGCSQMTLTSCTVNSYSPFSPLPSNPTVQEGKRWFELNYFYTKNLESQLIKFVAFNLCHTGFETTPKRRESKVPNTQSTHKSD